MQIAILSDKCKLLLRIWHLEMLRTVLIYQGNHEGATKSKPEEDTRIPLRAHFQTS